MERRWEMKDREENRAGSAAEERPGTGRSRARLLAIGAVAVVLAGVVYSAGKFVWRQIDTDRRIREAGEQIQPEGEPSQTAAPVPGQVEGRSGEEEQPIGLPPSPSQPAPATTPERLREEAIEVAERLIRDMPGRPEAIALLAVAHGRFGNSEEAVKCWQRSLDLDPKFAAAYDSMGRLAFYKGHYAEAAANLEKALAIAPSVSEIRPLLADALMALGKNEEAKAVLEKGLETSPEDAPTLFRLGKAQFHLKNYEAAKEKLEAAIQIDSNYTEAYYTLSSVCARLRLLDEVKKYREKFQALKAAEEEVSEGRRQALYREQRLPEFLASICYAAGNLYSRTGDATKAKRLWTKGATVNPKDVMSRHQLTLAYLRENRPEAARTILGQLRKIEPESPIHCLNLGFLEMRLRQFEAAEDAFRTASELAPKQSAGHVALAQLYMRTNRLPEAREAAQAAVDLEPTASNYSVLSAACARNGDPEAALAAIEKAIKMEPHNAEYARLYEQIQRSLHP